MKPYWLVFAFLGALAAWFFFATPKQGRLAQAHDHIIMYTQTDCGYCVYKARELNDAHIPFIEYRIDKEPERQRELTAKLQEAGFPPRFYGTPILDVYGVILPNNPSLASIRAAMKERRGG